jgi:dihydrofolate synthase/folylpolyglutamate synthase
VITSISFDHMKQLGHTLAAIAREKAGIVKPGVPIVCGVTDPEPQSVIAQIARDHGCRLIQLDRDFTYQYQNSSFVIRHSSFDVRLSSFPTLNFAYTIPGQEYHIAALPLAMRGPHQAANAAVALATIAELRHQGWCISEDAIRSGLSRAALPGRVEVFSGDPTVVLDAAHNPASARALVAALAELPSPNRRTLVLSISYDKDVRAIVRELAPHFERFVVTQYQENPRALPAERLAEMIHSAAPRTAAAAITVCPAPADAWRHVVQSTRPGELVCITGSFYLAAEMRPILLHREGY